MSKIYTDGSCINQRHGGWAFVVIENDEETFMRGGEDLTTNNRMEMMAVIKALSFVDGKEYTIYTDSQLVLNCAQRLWKRKANLDLWEEYDKASKGKTLTWIWVRGHSGDKYNEMVDTLAKNEAKKYEKK